jgi:hypothetical protein
MSSIKPERALANAAVVSFAVPDNRSGCVVDPAGSGRSKGGERFDMNIQYSSASGNVCANGEFRQYVRGTLQWRQRSTDPWNTLVHLLRNGVQMSPTDYNEDGFPDGSAYGYRSFNGCSDNFYTDAGHTTADRANGCYYGGKDFPGVTGPATYGYKVTLDFKGDAVDKTDGTVLQSNTWSVNCEGTL